MDFADKTFRRRLTRMNADFSPQRHRDKVSNLAMDGVGQGPSPEGAADL